MRHIGLVEGLLGLVPEVLIPDVDHRATPQCRQRLVRRLGRIDPHPRLRRIRQEPRVQDSFLVLPGLRVEFGAEGLVTCGIVRILQHRRKLDGTSHSRALPVYRMRVSEGEPGLVPQEDEMRRKSPGTPSSRA